MGLPAYQRPTWYAVHSQARGYRLVMFCLQDAIKDPSGIRFPVSGIEVQQFADALDAVPTTEKIEDLCYEQADIKLEPHTQRLWEGENDPVKHSLRIDEDIAGRIGMVRTVGKSWVLHPRMTKERAVNYGWPTKAKPSPTGPYVSHNGTTVWQPISTAHNWLHKDYSQTLCCLVKKSCFLGRVGTAEALERDIRNIMQDPNLSELVSYTGPLSAVRFPV